MSRRIAGTGRSWPGTMALLVLTTTGAVPAAETGDGDALRDQASSPNIVFILADDLGYGDLSCYNRDSKITTTRIDRLAAEGMRFTDAHSPSAVCTPTRYGVLTGRYAWRTRLERGVLLGASPHLIEPGRTTVATLLAAHGYATACIGKWHLGMDWPTRDGSPPAESLNGNLENIDYARPITNGPLTVGFDEFFGIPASLDMPPYCYIHNDRVVAPPTDHIEKRGGLELLRAGPIAPGFTPETVLATLTERAVRYIDEHAATRPDAPFFLYLPLTAPHTPVLPPARLAGASRAGPYGDFVLEVDWSVRRVLDALARHGLTDDTLVIFTSDNGSTMTTESLAEYGHAANHFLRGRKSDAWEGGHRVPFIASWPGAIAPGTTSTAIIGLQDLLATVAAIVGAELPPDAGEDSLDLLPILQGRAVPERVALIHHSINGVFAIRRGPWKLVLAGGSGGWSLREKDLPADAPPAQLYEMIDDPTELTNLYADHPTIVETLTDLLARCQAEGRTRPATD